MSDATQRLEHSRQRLRRFLVRTDVAAHQRENRKRQRTWAGMALAVGVVAGVLAWQKPWRRAPGLASAMAFVLTCLKAPAMLHTLASQLDMLAGWWRSFNHSQDEGAPGDESPPEPGEPLSPVPPVQPATTSAPSRAK